MLSFLLAFNPSLLPPQCDFPSLPLPPSLPFITATSDGPKHLDTTLTRVKFEELCSDLLARCRGPVEAAMKDAKLSMRDIKEVVLVGGSTRMPAVQVSASLVHDRWSCHQHMCFQQAGRMYVP